MARTLDLFADTESAKPRSKPRVLMHVFDSGDGCTSGPDHRYVDVQMQCTKCSHQTGWIRLGTVTEVKRGIPCPFCNEEKDDG